MSTSPFVIDRFDGEYEFLSNFYVQPRPCLMGGVEYPTVEHAFQAAKTTDAEKRAHIAQLPYAGQAKRAGRALALRPGWDDMRVRVMHRLVAQKFSDPSMRERLLATAPAELIEGNTWGDRFWGQVDGVGENYLGRILMTVRDARGEA